MSIEKAETLLETQPHGRMGSDAIIQRMIPWIVHVLQFLLEEYINEKRQKRKIL